MKIARSLLLGVFGFLMILPMESFAASRKVIIGFNQSPGQNEHNLIHNRKGHIRRAHRHIPAVAAEIPEEEIARLKNDPAIAYVVDDVPVMPIEPVQTQSASSPEYVDSWGVQRIGAEAAALRGFKGAGVKVAIVDSGIDYNHPDLKDNYRGGYNFVDNNSDPYDDASNSHGSHLAGIIAARDNGTGVVGVAPQASLYAVKIFGANAGSDLSTVIAGIEWAIDNKMDVVNLSLGLNIPVDALPAPFIPLKDVCDKAYKAGIVVVAAAGNNGLNLVAIPAAFDSVIAVSATDLNDQRAIFDRLQSSNYGAQIELAAPGKDIKSTVRGGGYALLSGTSQAAPHVAGAAAVLLSAGISDANGDGSMADDVRRLLAASAKDLGDPGRDITYGWGLVDLASAITQLDTRVVHLARTDSLPIKDAISVNLTKGVYSIKAKNNGLTKIGVQASDSGTSERQRIYSYIFKKGAAQETAFEVNFNSAEGTLLFIPYGKAGATADISITRVVGQAGGAAQ